MIFKSPNLLGFYIIFSNKINMKLITFIVLLACYSAINVRIEDSHLMNYGADESHENFAGFKLGDIIHYKAKKGDVTITYTFNGEQKQNQYTVYQYNLNGYNFDLFLQYNQYDWDQKSKKIDILYQWGRINGEQFLVLHTAAYRTQNIYQSIFYEALQNVNVGYYGDSFQVKHVSANEKNIPLKYFKR